MIMPQKLRIFAFFLLLCNLAAGTPAHSDGHSEQPSIPPGFELVTSSIGVQLFRKEYFEENPGFVQVIDLSRGASIDLLNKAMAQI